MRINTLVKVALLAVTITVVGCAKKGAKGGFNETGGGIGDSVQFFGQNVSPEQERELLTQRTFYFDYDSFNVPEKDTLTLFVHAKNLITGSKRHVRVEGHTDERGSREYNIALGERRAKAVANVLFLKGVPQNQVTVVSYGKERPVAMDHNESAYQLNRRAELVYETE